MSVTPPPIYATQPKLPAISHTESRPVIPPVISNNIPTNKRPTPPVATTSPAVLALLQEADTSSASGSLDNAASALERAIRIQPRNPQLWHKLAEIRLKQYQPGLAEDLAKKSNVLAQNDKTLTRQNWAIIAEARRKKGDATGAAQADAKAGH
jgi:predicted Zn-dependent protease